MLCFALFFFDDVPKLLPLQLLQTVSTIIGHHCRPSVCHCQTSDTNLEHSTAQQMQLRHNTHLKSSFNGFAFTVLVCRGVVVVSCDAGRKRRRKLLCYYESDIQAATFSGVWKTFLIIIFPSLRDRKTFLLSLFAPRTLVIVITSFSPLAFSHTIIFTLVNMAGLDRPEIRLRVRLEYQITVHCWLGKLLHVRWKWNSGDDEVGAKNDVKKIFCFYLHTSSRSVCSHANDPCCSRFSSLLKSCERVLILFAWKSRERERRRERKMSGRRERGIGEDIEMFEVITLLMRILDFILY